MDNCNKQDRRIRRTRKLLKESLIDLMQEKEFMNISVREITDRADLNRGTFYLHYQDTRHLLQEIEDETLEEFRKMLNHYKESPQKQSLMPMLIPLIDYAGDNAHICRILFENSAAIDFLIRLKQEIHQCGDEIIQELFPDTDDTVMTYFFEFVTAGLIGLMKKWLDSDQALPREQLAEIADQAILGTAHQLLKKEILPKSI